jgi:hypothetical protein
MVFSNLLEQTDIHLLLIKIIIIILIFIVTVLAARLSKKIIQRKIDKTKMDVTHLSFIKHFITGAIYFIGFALMIFQIDYLKSLAYLFCKFRHTGSDYWFCVSTDICQFGKRSFHIIL